MPIRVVVSDTYQRARDYMRARNLDPRHVRVVFDIEGAERLAGLRLAEDEVEWLALPHSFPQVIHRLVRRQITD